MSALRTLALGFWLMMIAVDSGLGGSIHPGAKAHPEHPGRMASAPTSLAFAAPTPGPNAAHALAAENLATTSAGPGSTFSYVANPSSPPQGSMSGLFLGMTGQNNGSVAYSPASTTNLGGSSPGAMPGGASQASPLPSPAPAVSMAMPPTAPASNSADAYINFGSGPYPEASSLTTGNPQSFLNSPTFTHLFGANGPSPTDVANFEQEVLATIKSTYNGAGLSIHLTSDPSSPAAHTISVVSGASYSGNPGAIGITDVGNNGFSFIDKFSGTQTVDQLAIAIGHNISHELMHAFGIANHPEQSGPYVDAATSTLQTLTDPSTGFSPAAASLLSTLNFQAVGQSVTAGAQVRVDGNQVLIGGASSVPEPSTVALWLTAGGLVIAHRRRKAA